MSRIGILPVAVPQSVSVSLNDKFVVLSSASGLSFSHNIPKYIICSFVDGAIRFCLSPDVIKKGSKYRDILASWGMLRSMVNNSITGLAGKLFTIEVNLVGVGYRVAVDKSSKFLIFGLGYSHDIAFAIPDGISVKCIKPTLIEVTSHDKCLVSQVVSKMEKLRPVEPYKGKGVYRTGKYILRKSGKKK